MTPTQKARLWRYLQDAQARGYRQVKPFGGWLHEVNPDWSWQWRHLVKVREYLHKITTGETKRLMIFMPPRHGKSEQVTVRYPVWLLEQDPAFRTMIGAYNTDLATNFSGLARDVAIKRGLILREDHNRADDWQTPQGGGIRAVGVGKGATGFGADLIVIDDPVRDQSEADSDAYQRSVWDWYTKVMRTRLEPGGAIILIMTRWSEDDLAGKLLERAKHGGEQWDVCRLPAFAETQAERDLWAREMGLPTGDPDPVGREPGEGLCPERFSEAELRATMEDVGPRGAEALYMQRPRPTEGALFKRDWFDITDSCPPDLRWVRYWDLAVETKTVNDHTASVALALDKQGELWIRDLVHERREWPDVRAMMLDTFEDERDRAAVQLIEKAIQGNAAVQELNREPRCRGIIIKGADVRGDKVTRALAWQSKAELRKVHLVQPASIRHCRPNWTEVFLAEVCSFGPGSKKDDIVDSVSGGYQEWTTGTLARAMGIVATGKTRGW